MERTHNTHGQRDLDDDVWLAPPVPAARGTRLRPGDEAVICQHGVTIASNNWLKLRCEFCGSEHQTPSEMVPFAGFARRDRDGVILSVCADCANDIRQGHKPGHNRHRRRRRNR